MQNTYLAHFGVKGQRWGVRRYQNEDGSLTPLGQKQINKMGAKDQKKHDLKEAKSVVRKHNLVKGLKIAGITLGVLGALTAMNIAQEASSNGTSFAQEGKKLLDQTGLAAKIAVLSVGSLFKK